jgi:short-subunit dehydrogenase
MQAGSPSRAIVTGASGGLGLEFAKLLAADKHDLVLIARSGDKLAALATDLRARYGVNVETLTADLSKSDAAAGVFAQVPACDILINNAGFATRGRFDEIPEERVREEMLIDVVTLTELTRKYLPGMRARGAGRILNVASTAGMLPGPFMAVYYACKAYVISFSQAIADELRGSGVTVTCLCPGATATGFAERAGTKDTLLFKLPVANATSVARAGYRGMLHGRNVVVPGLSNKLLELVLRLSARRAVLWVSRKTIE